MKALLSSCIVLLIFQYCVPVAEASDDDQYDYTKGPVPYAFTRGDHYPNRDEYSECRPIKLRIARNMQKFGELVTYSGNKMYFYDDNSRIMSSRMHSRLTVLADDYYAFYFVKLYILKAWTSYPDYSVANTSLHYEGRCVRVHVSNSNASQLLKFAISHANFDWVSWDVEGYARLCVIPDVCDTSLDIVFVLDQSGSIGTINNRIALQFLSSVIDFFQIAPNATQVGLITYSTHAYVRFDLDDFSSKEAIQDRISRIGYPGGWTATALGLFQAGVILNPQQQRGARPLTEGIPRVTVLLTDGRSNRLPIDEVTISLHASGVQVYTVGIGNIDLSELKFIASDPDRLHVYLLDSFNDAQGFVDFLSFTTCDTPAIVEPGQNTTTDVPGDSFRFFQTECNAFSVSVIIEQIDLYGQCHLYASSSKPNPGPLDDENSVVRNEDSKSDRRSVVLKLGKKIKRFVYISVRGIKYKNSFTVIIWDMLFRKEEFTAYAREGVVDQAIFDLDAQLKVTTERFYYRIKKGNDGEEFEIDNITGILYVRKPLSIAQQANYELLVVAENVNASCHRGKVTIHVIVVRNQLQFDPLSPVSIPETTPAGTNVTRVRASGGAGTVSYSIISGNVGNAFLIEQDTGDITVNDPSVLNFETRSQYNLTVQARSSPGGATATATQTINILDINEPPVFTTLCALNSTCEFSVFENLTVASLIGQIEADDPDLSSVPNGMLVYTLLPTTLPFIIDNLGRILLNESLDRETRDRYDVRVIVQDSGSPSLSIETNVTVLVMDVNDNAPRFVNNPQTRFAIREDTRVNTPLHQYTAVDDDIGINAVVTYNISSQLEDLPFSINPNNGLLTVSGPLDADEGVTLYTFDIVASNFDGLSTNISIIVEILDVNDNTPQFLQTPYTADVREHSPNGTVVIQINATDLDSGSNGAIEYSIVSGNTVLPFAIDANTGLITVSNDIDRETAPMFTFIVKAEDQGQPTRQNRVEVNITVLDINDNAPEFRPDIIRLTLPEDQQLGPLVTLTAFDRDDPSTLNAMILYSITNGNSGNHFFINNLTGQLLLVSSLDFEEQNSFNLTVIAKDQGTPVMSGSAMVYITVTNVNDHPPNISGNVEIDVLESEPIGFEVAQFTATDLDEMTIIFHFASCNDTDGPFAINETTGIISLRASLDFEDQRQHILTVVANDGKHTSNATLTVNVIDVNEFSPEFSGLFNFSVKEEEPAGTVLGTMIASDGDASDVITYFIRPGGVSDLFRINSTTGVITTTQKLDRELLVEEGHFVPPNCEEVLVVVATDNAQRPGPRQTSQNITIRLIDINDNPPVFDPTSYNTTIAENTVGETALFNVSATDGDIGSNGMIRYSLENSSNTVDFTIDPVTGQVSAIQPFDRENIDIYRFNIFANDLGTPQTTATATATVRVTDKNDNAPRFLSANYVRNVAETTAVNTILFQVTAVDDDIGINAEITYSISGRENCASTISSPCFFNISENNGLIRLARSLDFETQTQHNITIIATDGGTPMQSASQLVTFNVINVDERGPEFEGPCNASVPEDINTGSVVTRCPAVDFNELLNRFTNDITYSIIEGNEGQVFSIDSNGTITNRVELDRETTPSYTIKIRASDGTLTTDMEVTITVLDVNDNTPQFVGAPYAVSLSDTEIANYRSAIVTVQATDADIGNNSLLTYSITNTDINLGSKTTNLTVTVSDAGTPSLSNTTCVIVTFESSCTLQDYTITSDDGKIVAQLLCSITISPTSLSVIIGQNISLTCNVLRNVDVSVEFLHNSSSTGTSENLRRGDNDTVFERDDAEFDDSGQYECKATTLTSISRSLQTAQASTVNILVPAEITTPPSNITVESGSPLITFTCVAIGVPTPTFSWLRENQALVRTSRILPDGQRLRISNVALGDQGLYTCQVRNVAGNDSASAHLIVFELQNLVLMEISRVSRPDPILNCNSFNSTHFQNMLSSITNQQTLTTNVGGNLVCDSDACHPNPCVNGTCNVTSTGNYQCTCTPGYMGKNCDQDINECNDLACLNGGTCENIAGGFICHCPSGYYGDLCDYNNDKCLCPPGTECLEFEGVTQCVFVANNTLLVIEEPLVENVVMLDNIVNTLVEDGPSSSRRKRNGYVTVCSGKFVKITGKPGYSLVWVCPDEAQPPSTDKLQSICEQMIKLQVIRVCHVPGRSTLRLTDVPPSTVQISFIIVDSNSGEVMSAQEVLQLLEASGALDKLRQSGFNVTNVQAASPTVQSVSSDNVGGIVGGVVGGVLSVFLVILLVAIVVCVVIGQRRKRNKRIAVPTDEINEKGGTIMSNMTVLDSLKEERYSRVGGQKLPINTEDNTFDLSEKSSSSPLHSPVNPYVLFDDPIYATTAMTNKPEKPVKPAKTSTLERAKRHHLEKSSSLEKLLDEDDDSPQEVHTRSLEDDDEPIYGNMNFEWQGKNAGDRWENYWKTKTITRGIDPPKNH